MAREARKCISFVGSQYGSKLGDHCSALILFVLTLTWLLVPGATRISAQSDDPLAAIGIPPFSQQLPVQNGSINVSTGNLHLEFPLASIPQRGGPPLKIALVYDTNVYRQSSFFFDWNSNPFPNPTYSYVLGWQLQTSYDEGWANTTITPSNAYCQVDGLEQYDTYTTWLWTSPDGATHFFPITTTYGWVNACGDYSYLSHPAADGLAIDGSGYHMYLTNFAYAQVYSPNGTLVYSDYSGGNPKDTNGNYANSNTTFTFNGTDTLKRTPLTITSSGNTTTIGILNSRGAISNYVVTLEPINVHTNFGDGGFSETIGTNNAIQSILLPDGTSYSFNYDSGTSAGNYGQLKSMTLPTGGTISYLYSNFLDAEYSHITRMISTMTTPDGVWTFTPAVITQCTSSSQYDCQQSLTVTGPSYSSRNDNSVYKSILSGGAWLIESEYYTGTVSTSNLVAKLVTSFDLSHHCSYIASPFYLCSEAYPIAVTRMADTITLPGPSGTSVNQTAQYCYDMNNGNLLYKWEWNFYTGAIVHDPNPPPTCSLYSGSTPARTTTTAYLNGSNYLAKNIYNRPISTTITDSGGNIIAKTVNSYDGSTLVTTGATGIANHDDTNFGSGNTVRGNLTQIQRLVSGTSSYLTKSMTYDITGQPRTETDWANGNPTTYSYADNFSTDIGDASNPSTYTPSTSTNAYLTTVTHPTVNSVTLTDTFGYYWGTGQKSSSTDASTQTTYFHFYDLLNRSTSSKVPNTYSSSCCGWSYTVYPNGSESQLDTSVGITSITRSITCTGSSGDCRHDQLLTDSLGRTTSRNVSSDPDGQTSVNTSYDSYGRVYSISNPHRSGSSPTDGTEYYAYDGLNRKIQVTRPDGSIAYTYYGATVGSNGGRTSQLCSGGGVGYPILSKDEAAKLRQTWTDGFGRLIEVDEPDLSGSLSTGLATCYSYDLNDNLTGVTQGVQTRTFSYDLLSRLMSATNPESGMTSYYYTTSGGSLCSGDPSAVCRKTDARGVTTTYAYDVLNRLISKSYSDSTPQVKYGYDAVAPSGCTPPTLTITNGKGRRTSMCDGAGKTAWAYDEVGNIKTETRTTNNVTTSVTYSYNLDSSIATIGYPSGRTVTYQPGGAQRPQSVRDLANGINYGTNAHYMPPGELASLTHGGNIVLTTITNSRLQPCWQYATTGTGLPWASTTCTGSAGTGNLLDLKYAYNLGSSDNGNVIGITNNKDTTRSETFTYDSLNRVATAAASTYAVSPSHCWGEAYTIDRYGNLTSIDGISMAYDNCTQNNPHLSVSTSTNRISGFIYDLAGELTSDGTRSLQYDAEGRITSVAGINYLYDGDGRRVVKSAGGTAYRIYWYGISDAPLVETDGQGNTTDEHIFFNGRRIARHVGP